MPIGDWQFWVVTLVAAVGLWKIVRMLWPKKRTSGCSHCASGSAASVKKRPTKVSLTVDRKHT